MKKIEPFALERYFARHEFSARYLLSSSDCEALSLTELLETADSGARRLWETLKFGYTETYGHPALRESIADIYQGLGAENILVAVPEEGIFLLMQALLEPGDHVICTFPGYQSLYEVARSMGCRVSMWQPNEERGWHFDLRQLEEMMEDETRLVVVNFPHNPTGSLPARADFESLVALVAQKGAYLFSDEMYRFLEIDPDSKLPACCEVYDKAISLFGLSKTFGLPGLRIGWLAAQDRDILERISILKDYTTICSSAPSEILAIMALRSREQIIAGQWSRISRNIKVLDEFFIEYQDCLRWNRPQGGSICFPRLLISENSFDFCGQLVKETGIMLVPSRIFKFGDRHVRIGFGRENLPQVLEMFAGYLDLHYR